MRINRSRHLDMLERAGWEAMAFGVIDDYKTHIKHLETERDQHRARLHEGDAPEKWPDKQSTRHAGQRNGEGS